MVGDDIHDNELGTPLNRNDNFLSAGHREAVNKSLIAEIIGFCIVPAEVDVLDLTEGILNEKNPLF